MITEEEKLLSICTEVNNVIQTATPESKAETRMCGTSAIMNRVWEEQAANEKHAAAAAKVTAWHAERELEVLCYDFFVDEEGDIIIWRFIFRNLEYIYYELIIIYWTMTKSNSQYMTTQTGVLVCLYNVWHLFGVDNTNNCFTPFCAPRHFTFIIVLNEMHLTHSLPDFIVTNSRSNTKPTKLKIGEGCNYSDDETWRWLLFDRSPFLPTRWMCSSSSFLTTKKGSLVSYTVVVNWIG